MDRKNWLQKINPFRDSERSQIKSLQERLDTIVSESDDGFAYEAKSVDSEPSSGAMSVGGGSDLSGIEQQIDVAALQRTYMTETWVYAAVETIAESVAALPWKLEKAKTIQKVVTNQVTGEQEYVEQKVWIDASGEKLFDAFEYPNRYTTRTEFLMLLIIDLLTAGEYYIYLDAAEGTDLAIAGGEFSDSDPNGPFARLRSVMATGKPIDGMYRIPPSVVKPVMSEDKRHVAGYAIQTSDGDYAFGAAEMIHVRMPNPLDPFRGLSPLIPAFKSILMDRFSTEHIVRFYKTGARLGGVIESEKSINKEQLARFQRSFENNYTGRQNHHRTLVLPPGMTYNTIEQNPAETALLEFCKYNREAILAVFKVPPIKLGILEGSSYANATAQLKTFYNDCIKPKLGFIQDGFNLKSALMPDARSFRIQFDLSGIVELREDLKTTAEAGKLMLEAGVTINEVRHRVWQLPAIKGGDKSPVLERMSKPGGLFSNLFAEPGSEKEVAEGGGNTAVVQVDIGTGKPKKPCECGKDEEQCDCGKKQQPTLTEYLTDALGKLADGETVDPAFIQELIEIYNSVYGTALGIEAKEVISEETPATEVQGDATATQVASELPGEARIPRFSIEKSRAQAHWKSFIDVANPLIEKRYAEVRKFFKEFQSILLNRFGGNIKAYGMFKARDTEDVDSILDVEGYQDLIKKFTSQVDKALADAYQYGFDSTLAKFVFGPPNEAATEYLAKYAAQEVTNITQTTMDQMRDVLTQAFKDGISPGEVTKRVREKFDQIDQGRAATIARTETLSAVSAGRQEKRDAWKAEFPDRKLQKQWVTSQDERVRGDPSGLYPKAEFSHYDMDGEVVDSDKDFSNGLAYPREQGGEAGNIINCRCDEITFDAEDADLIAATLPKEDSEDTGKSAEKPCEKCGKSPCACPNGNGTKGGAGSGCRGDHCGRPAGSSSNDIRHGAPSGEINRIGRPPLGGSDWDEKEKLVEDTAPLFDAFKAQYQHEAQAIRDWTDSDYVSIRAVQQGKTADMSPGKIEQTQHKLSLMNDAFDKLPAYHGPIVRSIEADPKAFKEGAVFTTEAYSSFSAKDGLMSSRSVKIIVENSEAGKAIWGLSGSRQEMEVLIPKGVSYRVNKVEKYEDPDSLVARHAVYVEEISSKGGAKDISALVSAAMDAKIQVVEDSKKHYCAAGIHTKGGPGSGCHGDNCGRPAGRQEDASTRTPRAGTRPRELYPERYIGTADNKFGALNPNAGSSQEAHMENGKYSMRRALLHRSIINEIVREGAVSDEPVAIIMGGGSGAGKSTVLATARENFSGTFSIINSDNIKENSLPEYADMVKNGQASSAAAFTHEESSDIARQAMNETIAGKRNMMYDSTLSNTEKSTALIKRLKDNGYTVHVIYADLPVNEAIRRSDLRAEQTGRVVPHDVILKAHQGAMATLGQIKHLPDSVTVYNNSGKQPTVAYRRSGSTETVRDAAAVEDMRRRGLHV